MNLTEEQILALAPDESSKKAGKELSNASRWVTRGSNELALWGEAQGSGSKPYQTQVDVNHIAFKCSCPSRKFPCKHGLGLLLFHARQPHLFTTAEMPAWVSEWISKRTQKEEKKGEKEDKPVDEAAQAKRLENREKKVADGIEELLLWMKDMVRNGIISLPEKGFSFWEQMAKRMVDAQAPGLAGMVRALNQVPFYKEGWQTTFLEQLLHIYLIVNAWKNKAAVSPLLHMDARSWIGFTQKGEALKEQQGIEDTWLVLAKQVSEEDNLTVERYWLHGIETAQYALVLQFIVNGQGASLTLTPGMYLQAELNFFPSLFPLRALIKKQETGKASLPKKMYAAWKEIGEKEWEINRESPFTTQRPYLIKQVTPVQYQDSWWLADRNQDLVQVTEGFTNIWKLLAISGGHPVDMAIIGKENEFEPLGIWENETYKSL